MLPETVELYLSTTRGTQGFIESNDEDINEFVDGYKSTLIKNFIKVVVIDSPLAKTEMLECDEENYLIWDKSFFENVCSYIFYMLNIQAVYLEIPNAPYDIQKTKCQTLMNALFYSLLKHQIQNTTFSTSSQQKTLEDYCSKYAESIEGIIHTKIEYEKLAKTFYFAKYYIFSHELAHITYKNDKDNLNFVFDIAQKYLNTLSEKPKHFSLIEKHIEKLNKCDNYDDYSFYQEIMADTRAVQTIWSRLIVDCLGEIKTVFSDFEISLVFPKILEAQDGIDLVRSYLVRSSNLRYLIDALISNEAEDRVFIDFIIRDYFSNPINLALLYGFDNGTGRGMECLKSFQEYRSNRNIAIIDDLFADEFNRHISLLKRKLANSIA